MRRPIHPTLLAVALAAVMAGCSPQTGSGPAANVPATTGEAITDKAAHLDRLYAQYWEDMLKHNPLAATYQGDPRYNDQLPNFLSREYRDASHALTQGWLEKIESVGAEGLEGQDLLSWQVFVEDARDELAGEKFPSWMQPVNQFYNIASTFVQLGSGSGAQPFKTVEDYDNWRKRAGNVPALFNQAIANMGEGIEAGVVQPRVLMEKVLPQLDALIKDDPRQTLFWKPVSDLPASFPEADRKRIEAEYTELIATVLMPAYVHLRDYIAKDYLPKTRDSVGMAGLPDGEAWYAYRVRQSTTTELPPERIHQIGRGRTHPGADAGGHGPGWLQGHPGGVLRFHAERSAIRIRQRGGVADVLSRAGGQGERQGPGAVLAGAQGAIRDPSGGSLPCPVSGRRLLHDTQRGRQQAGRVLRQHL